jgi:EAL domain-containing protein (putative c-di-GMP-specific phosphodiesterase class I)/AmiR/NasT family two-component response regulator
MRALVIDDDDLVRRSLTRLLTSMQVEVSQAGDGFAAVQAIESNAPFDVIFCDLQMPGRDGVQTLRDLAERKVASGLVLLSGHAADIVVSAANTAKHHGLNVLGHLQKPFDRDKIKILLEAASKPQAAVARGVEIRRQPLTKEDLRQGLEAKEFTIVLQPKVNPSTGIIDGSEALVRWTHSKHGMISPVEFIPLAEESELIDELTEAVMDRAVAGYNLIRKAGFAFPIAVNLSTRSMSRLDLADRLLQMVKEGGATSDGFIFEVTESRLADNITAFMETATRLRLMGFKLSIDDFGTGFSTMEQVGRLPVSELKIDRAFVAGTPNNPTTRHILEASLQLGRSLSLKCVCEGVETEEEWDLVRRLGADTVQGYFIAKPMDTHTFVGWVREWSAKSKSSGSAQR